MSIKSLIFVTAGVALALGVLFAKQLFTTKPPVQILKPEESAQMQAIENAAEEVRTQVFVESIAPSSVRTLESEIQKIEDQRKDVEHQLAQKGFPEVFSEPRLTKSEADELNGLLKKRSQLTQQIITKREKLIDLKYGALE